MADQSTITFGKQFTEYYYGSFGQWERMAPVLLPETTLNWEGVQTVGGDKIVEKLKDPPFNTIRHKVSSVDIQQAESLLLLFIHVTGLLILEEGQNPLQFSQSFILRKHPQDGNYKITNDIFRLNYG